MSGFKETEHPRESAGRFAEKTNSAPETGLPQEEIPYVPGTLGGYSVKNFRTHSAGMEGTGFTATLYRDGKRVLNVSNDGNGGSNRYELADRGNGSFEEASRLGKKRDEILAELNDTAYRLTGQTEATSGYFEPDLFIDYVEVVTKLQKHADKIGVSYGEVAEANHDQFSIFSDTDQALILNPEKAGR